MGSLVDELRLREAAARAEADRLRARVQELAEGLERAEEQVTRLVIAREEVTRILEGPVRVEPPAGEPGVLVSRPGSPVGAVTVPAWREGADAAVLPRPYQDLLEVAADAGRTRGGRCGRASSRPRPGCPGARRRWRACGPG